MSLHLTSAPAVEPITLAEAKAHMRVDTTDDDLLIAALIATSRLQIEAALDLALIHQTWSLFLDAWPGSKEITLPLSPAASLVAIRTYDQNDLATPLPLTSFQLDTAQNAPRLMRKSTFTSQPLRHANGIEISFIAGFGATSADVPAPIRHALLLLVAHWYDHRDPAEVTIPATKIPDIVSSLLAPYRRTRLV